jgi:hypothetical protein
MKPAHHIRYFWKRSLRFLCIEETSLGVCCARLVRMNGKMLHLDTTKRRGPRPGTRMRLKSRFDGRIMLAPLGG